MMKKLSLFGPCGRVHSPLSPQKAFRSRCLAMSFVKVLLLAALLVASGSYSPCFGVERTLVTIVHTNDLHSQLTPNMNGGEPVGGIARIATLINRIRASEPYVIVLDSGDLVLGTPFFTFYGGRAEIDCMNAIGYDAMTVGNHELDSGPRALLDLADHAEFPFLSANLVWRRNGELLLEPYVLFETEEDVKLAVLGLTMGGIAGIVKPSAVSSVTTESPVATARRLVPMLREAADAVIVLSHLGLEDDKKLARRVPGIDIIVGGHSHDLLEKPAKIPGTDKDGHPNYTYIVQAGSHGTHLGRVDLLFEGSTLALVDSKLIPVTSVVWEDYDVARIVLKYWESMESEVTEVVAYASEEFARDNSLRWGESPLGNLIADVIRDATGADFAVQNAGGIRSSLGPGPVTVWDIYSALPFDNKLVKLELNGAKVEELVSDIARRVGRGSFCQVSGISFDVIDKKPHDIKVEGKPLEIDRTYTVGATDYLVEGGCQYDAITGARVLHTTSEFQRDFAVEYLRKLKVLRPHTEGRIKVSRGGG